MFDTMLLNNRTPLNCIPCLSPVKVNVHGEDMYVPCGHCQKCISSKLNVQKSLTDRLMDRFPFRLFVTLTYDEDNVPKFSFDPTGHVDFLNRDVLESDKLFLLSEGYDTLSPLEIKSIREDIWFNPTRKYRTCDYVRYINYHDVQVLIKRVLRYAKKNFPESKITYVGCSEYGEKYLRPHFHLLLFVETTSQLYGLVRFFKRKVGNRGVGARCKCWQYGHCDTRIVTDTSVSGYVSSYVSCNSTAPQIFQRREFRGKFFHGQNALALSSEKLVKEVSQTPVECFVDKVLLYSDDDKERVRIWSDYNRMFKRFPNFMWITVAGITSFFGFAFKKYEDFLDSDYDSLYRYVVHYACDLLGRYINGSLDFFENYYLDGYDSRKLVAHYKYCFSEEVNKVYRAFLNRIYFSFLVVRHYYHLVSSNFSISSEFYVKCLQIVESYKIRSQYMKLSLIDDESVIDSYYSYFESGDIDVFDDSSYMFAYYTNLLSAKDKSKKVNEPFLFNN